MAKISAWLAELRLELGLCKKSSENECGDYTCGCLELLEEKLDNLQNLKVLSHFVGHRRLSMNKKHDRD